MSPGRLALAGPVQRKEKKMLVGEKVTLRTIRQADLEVLYDLGADVRYMGSYWPLHIYSEIRRNKRFAETGGWQEDSGTLLIVDKKDRVVGHILFFKPSPYQSSYEVGYRIYRPEDQGQGYMSESVSLLVAYLFGTQHIDRIQATTLPDNVASQKVLERCGFQFEGVMRQALFHQGRSQDLRLYAIVRDNARPLKEFLAPI
jgi:RimJ/RimL family protein N-acetyltransferase